MAAFWCRTGTVLAIALSCGTAMAQNPSLTGRPPVVTVTTEPLATGIPVSATGNSAPMVMPANIPSNSLASTPPAAPPPAISQPSPVETWTANGQPSCCGPTGANGPVSYDLYVRMGPTMPVAGGVLNEVLNTGWDVRAGARTLFFNPTGSSAWYVDTSLGYAFNGGRATEIVTAFGVSGTVRDYSRWNVGLGLGKEWYTSGPGFVSGAGNWNWSYGFDVGGRWGTSSIDFNVFNQPFTYASRHDVIGGVYAGFNSHLEFPMGAWTLLAGMRAEWAMTWTDNLIPGTNGNLSDLNLLLSGGVRY